MSSNRTNSILPELERSLTTGAAAQRRGTKLSTRVGRVAAIGATCLAFGGTAMAATGVWNPTIGDNVDSPPPAVSATPVPAAMADAVGVFRRAPDAQDHGPAVEATLSILGSKFADGIRPDSVRYLGANANGEAAILVSAERSVYTDDTLGARFFGSGEPACVVVPHDGEAIPTCFGLDQILAGGAKLRVERLDAPYEPVSSGEVWGLVPDGVASVTTPAADGSERRLQVTDNHFSYRWGSPGADPADGGLSFVISPFHDTVWYDADGNVVPQQPAG